MMFIPIINPCIDLAASKYRISIVYNGIGQFFDVSECYPLHIFSHPYILNFYIKFITI